MYPVSGINWGGIAAVIGAVGGFLGICVNLTFQIINFIDMRKARMEQEKHKALLCNIANQVGADTNAKLP